MNDYANLKARLKAPLYQWPGEKTDIGMEAAAAIDALERERERFWRANLALQKSRDAAEARVKRLDEALLWCSGSNDFNEGGVARKGWLKICAPLLAAMSDDDLIRRGDVLALQDRFMGVVTVEKIATIPAVTPGVRVKPTDAQLASACMSYRHDFGLLDGLERTLVLHQARDWLHAWQKELDLTPQPAPAMRPETDMEHIARDMRDARFPERSERQVVPVDPQTAPDVAGLVEAAKALRNARLKLDDTPEFCALIDALAAIEGKP